MHVESSSFWDRKARARKQRIDKHLWSPKRGTYVDYNTASRQQSPHDSVTCLWALWCGVASPRQALALVAHALPRFEQAGGLSSTARRTAAPASQHAANSDDNDHNKSDEDNVSEEPCRQWDYPFGWAPHQVLAWDGLWRYGFKADARRLAYRWLHTLVRVAVDFNGAMVEKYDVRGVRAPHRVAAEYGNQGARFEGLAREG